MFTHCSVTRRARSFVPALLVAAAAACPVGAVFGQGPIYEYRQGGHAHGVFFRDSDHGCLAEDGGRIRYWHAPTSTWKQANTPIDYRDDLRGVFMLDFNDAWAVGVGGCVLKSEDDGVSWVQISTVDDLQSNPVPSELFDIWMIDEFSGWLCGGNGVLQTTSDSGQSWTTPPELLGNPPVIQNANSEDPDDIYDIAILDDAATLADGTIIAAADWGRYYRRASGQTQWTQHQVNICPAVAPGESPKYLELWAVDYIPGTNECFMSGGVGTNGGQMFYSSDAGLNFVKDSRYVWLPNPFPNQCIAPTFYHLQVLEAGVTPPFNVPEVYAVGYGSVGSRRHPGTTPATVYEACGQDVGACAAQSNAGMPYWVQELTPEPAGVIKSRPPFSGMHAFKAGADLVDTWVCGRSGIVKRSLDRCATFTDYGSVSPNRLAGGDFWNSSQGCVIGQGNVIQRTTDAAQNLTAVHPAASSSNYNEQGVDIDLSGSGQGVAIGQYIDPAAADQTVATGCEVWVTSDHGLTWSAATSAGTSWLNACCAIDNTQELYVCGPNGLVGRSDGGAVWTNISVPNAIGVDLMAIDFMLDGSFYNGQYGAIGCAVGSNKMAYVTHDRGVSWTQLSVAASVPAGTQFNGVALDEMGGVVWVVGTGGQLLRSTNGGTLGRPGGYGAIMTSDTLFDVDVTSPGLGNGLIVFGGDKGRVVHFDGTDWSAPKTQTSEPIYSVCFQNNTHGFIVGHQFLISEFH